MGGYGFLFYLKHSDFIPLTHKQVVFYVTFRVHVDIVQLDGCKSACVTFGPCGFDLELTVFVTPVWKNS